MVRDRFNGSVKELRLTRQTARMRFPLDPAGTVDFFRRYYGPTLRAFDSLDAPGQAALRRDLVELQTRHNASTRQGETDTPAEYLEVQARKGATN